MKPNPKTQAPLQADRAFERVVLRLVKGGPERLAIAAGQIDAVVDRASGTAILLPAAQQALIARKANFQSLIGLSSDWYWVQDEHYRFLSYSSTAVDDSGFAHKSYVGQALWDLPFDNMSETDWRTHRQQLEWRATYRDLELRYVDRAGRLRYFSVSGEPIFDDHHQFKGYRGITRDISVRKRAEILALEKNEFACATLDALAVQVAVLDSTGTVLVTNQAWRVSAGVAGIAADVCETANFLAACEAADGHQSEDARAVGSGLRQVLAAERDLFQYEYACDSAAGRRWFALDITRVDDGSAARAVVTRENISERRHGELLLELELRVARQLADAGTARSAIQAVIRSVCETQGWECGRHYRLESAAGVLRFDEAWGVATAEVRRFLEKSRGQTVRPGAGLTGRVLRSGQPLWVFKNARGSGVSPTALAPETCCDGAFVFPVVLDGKTVGVLAFSCDKLCAPDDRMLRAVRSIGEQLGRFLQRQQALDELRRSEALFRRLTELSTDCYWEQDREFRFTWITHADVLGACELLGKTLWEQPRLVPQTAEWAEHCSQLAAQWSFCDFVFASLEPDGQRRYFSFSGEPVYDEAGAFTGYCGTGMDITERKRAELGL
ncbi:MAG: PAS domain S-box protein [Panacagrimonas sp.]